MEYCLRQVIKILFFNWTIISLTYFALPDSPVAHTQDITASLISLVSLLLDCDSLGIKGRIVFHALFMNFHGLTPRVKS